jgi:hypothetical protein
MMKINRFLYFVSMVTDRRRVGIGGEEEMGSMADSSRILNQLSFSRFTEKVEAASSTASQVNINILSLTLDPSPPISFVCKAKSSFVKFKPKKFFCTIWSLDVEKRSPKEGFL